MISIQNSETTLEENNVFPNVFSTQDLMLGSSNLFILICFLFYFILFGCNRDEKGIDTYIKGSSDYIHLNTAGSISPKTKFLQYYEEPHKAWLLFGNEDKNEVILYELPSGKIEKRMKFEMRGPNRIGVYKGAYIHNFDSIFIQSGTYYKEFLLIDTTGTVIRQFSVDSLDIGEFHNALAPLYSHYSMEAVFRNGLLNLNTYVLTAISNADLHTQSICISYDIGKGELVERFKYPKFDDTHLASLEGYCRTHNGSDLVYSFNHLDDLYILKENGDYELIPCPSQFQSKDLDWTVSRTAPIEIQKERVVQNPRYGSIMFDKYRKLFYRIYIPGYKLKNGESADQYSGYPPLFSIMVLDENLTLIGETLMPMNTYDPQMAFITRDGLFLALHPDNPKYNPDSLAFEKMIVLDN